MKSLERFKARGEANGARGLEIVDKKRLAELDPSAIGEFALYSPDSGILDPMAYTVALAENAAMNGAEFLFGRDVVAVSRREGLWELTPAAKFSIALGRELGGHGFGGISACWASPAMSFAATGRIFCPGQKGWSF